MSTHSCTRETKREGESDESGHAEDQEVLAVWCGVVWCGVVSCGGANQRAHKHTDKSSQKLTKKTQFDRNSVSFKLCEVDSVDVLKAVYMHSGPSSRFLSFSLVFLCLFLSRVLGFSLTSLREHGRNTIELNKRVNK